LTASFPAFRDIEPLYRTRAAQNAQAAAEKYKPFTQRAMIDQALALGGKGKVFCPDCGKPIVLRESSRLQSAPMGNRQCPL
jgi:predicted RNA-binding Zn-ribbon protein involved in translation (DUF1610 family)